ncbi:uncharacterized protein [Solanum tuberosum]|uniref:Uncharacterized protein n=1 Tax=Solanum tuberosum TaxID=4113 RepID=M1BB04_SOLTU|nr:PREDICTED: uncharacterized protein LOC102578809 isoform X2 [Solanum tuberosum]
MERLHAKDFINLVNSSSFISEGELFDASQYAFFGGDVEKVELGGLLEDNDNCIHALGDRSGDDEVSEYHLFEKDELNRNVTGPWHPGLGVIGDCGSESFFRESSSTAEWTKEADFLNWFDQDFSDSESYQEAKDGLHSHISLLCILRSRNHCIGHPQTLSDHNNFITS